MNPNRLRVLIATVVLALALRPAMPGAAQARPPSGAEAQPTTTNTSENARDTRDRLRELLDEYPPSVGQVLRLDPSLLTRSDYLSTYPKLAGFLAQHPEVAHNPVFFLGDSGYRLIDNR